MGLAPNDLRLQTRSVISYKARMEDRRIFENSIRKFVDWLDKNGTAGYDPYDLWSTRYGTRARRLFYRFGNAAALISAPLILAERLMPRAARMGVVKRPYA